MDRSTSPDQVAVLGTVRTALGQASVVLTPVGVGHLTFAAEGLALGRAWVHRWMPHARVVPATTELTTVAEELEAYFAGERHAFSIPVDLRGTAFQLHVWHTVQQIAYGTVASYGHVATVIGRPHAARAVGAANGANPVSLLVPCHRLVGRNGELISYRGGVGLKRYLLRLEGVLGESDSRISRQKGC